MEESQTTQVSEGSSVSTVRNWAKSTCACLPGGRFETPPEDRRWSRPSLTHEPGDGGVAAAVIQLANFPEETPARQPRGGPHPLAEIRLERVEVPRTRPPRAIDRRLRTAGDVCTDRLAVEARLPRDGGDGRPWR